MPDFTTSDGLRLHYEDRGEGTAILCLSGLTRNSTDFDYVAPHLSGRVIALDYRGRGKSDWAESDSYSVPVEARDALELLDHLELPRAAILGTSRGGLIAMLIAATAKDRLTGVCLNDIGPEIAPEGIAAIMDYIGRAPEQATLAEAAAIRSGLMAGFEEVPQSRWIDEVAKHYVEGENGLTINYDPGLADAVRAGGAEPAPDMWPLFDALEGLPLAAIRGRNSNLLSPETFAEMQRRRPDMIAVEVPGRGHVPFLDEPEALDALARWQALL
ncbi:alpha/beta hydrolase [Palleronia sp. LCG004]|uniref:alpha/beta fold hydrolase n=1 Tax=Palleronia sp. LCG004 TaxID=3079304 RepID=UPI002941CE34|nr:alpha/beta hydrolase [Palleronia sp. LCG004]WOI55778.1 alpha/beta hydrolase [Palleronia sp. LCG004]